MEITYYKKNNSGKRAALLGEFSVMLSSGMELRGCEHLTGQYGEYVKLPHRRYQSEEGEYKDFFYVHIADRDRKNAFQKNVLEAIGKWKAANEAGSAATSDEPYDVPF